MCVCLCRDGSQVFFERLSEQQVPLLILSAGVGDVLEEVIRQNHVFHPNVHVVSNYMDFDQTVSWTMAASTCIVSHVHYCTNRPSLKHCLVAQGVLQAFKGQLIHTFNKREGALSHAAGLRELQGRPNVLLLGDSLGDLTMADGVSEPQHVLTIGFLNDQV